MIRALTIAACLSAAVVFNPGAALSYTLDDYFKDLEVNPLAKSKLDAIDTSCSDSVIKITADSTIAKAKTITEARAEVEVAMRREAEAEANLAAKKALMAATSNLVDTEVGELLEAPDSAFVDRPEKVEKITTQVAMYRTVECMVREAEAKKDMAHGTTWGARHNLSNLRRSAVDATVNAYLASAGYAVMVDDSVKRCQVEIDKLPVVPVIDPPTSAEAAWGAVNDQKGNLQRAQVAMVALEKTQKEILAGQSKKEEEFKSRWAEHGEGLNQLDVVILMNGILNEVYAPACAIAKQKVRIAYYQKAIDLTRAQAKSFDKATLDTGQKLSGHEPPPVLKPVNEFDAGFVPAGQ